MTDLIALSRATAPEAGYRPPTRFERLFPFQQAAVAQDALRKHMLLAHAPGLGKTPMSLALARGRFVIVCPPSIASQWQAKAMEWLGGSPPVLDTSKLATKPPSGSFIVSDSLVHLLPETIAGDVLIVDEVHRFKNRETRRTISVLGGKVPRQPEREGLAHRFNRLIGLTGTPLKATPLDLFPFLHRTVPSLAPTFEDFTERYCPPAEMRVPGSPYPVKRYDLKLQNLDELAARLRSSVMIRPAAADCLTQLPEIIEDTYHLGIDDPASETLSAEQLAAVFTGDTESAGTLDRVAIARLRRETGLAIAHSTQLHSWLRDLIDDGSRPLLWCWHQEVAAYLAAKLDLGLIHGGVPMPARAATVEAFRTGRLNGLAATIGAAGTGLDGLQHGGSLCIFVERHYDAGDNEQAIARLHRAGQTRGVRVVTVRTPTAIDRGIQAALRRKTTLIKDVLT